MRRQLGAGVVVALALCGRLAAHRVDEYLQATTISLEKDRIAFQVRLTPGTAVLPLVMAAIDTDNDGTVSAGEQQAYAERVLRDVSLTVDGERLKPKLTAATFPEVAAMREGVGEIKLDFTAEARGGGERKLVFENHHQAAIGTYLVNTLEPADPAVRVLAQKRNYEQTRYEMDYSKPGARAESRWWWWLPAAFLALLLWRWRGTRSAR